MTGRISSIVRNRRRTPADQPKPFRLVDLQRGYRRMGRSQRHVLRALREQSKAIPPAPPPPSPGINPATLQLARNNLRPDPRPR